MWQRASRFWSQIDISLVEQVVPQRTQQTFPKKCFFGKPPVRAFLVPLCASLCTVITPLWPGSQRIRLSIAQITNALSKKSEQQDTERANVFLRQGAGFCPLWLNLCPALAVVGAAHPALACPVVTNAPCFGGSPCLLLLRIGNSAGQRCIGATLHPGASNSSLLEDIRSKLLAGRLCI